jgi:aspartate 1-decarboxylase
MERLMLKSKIHGATITGTELDYQGSITIDRQLLEKVDILPGEQVQVLNLNNGNRFTTYAIAGNSEAGEIVLNGPAARLGETRDKIIVISYCQMPDNKAKDLTAKVVFVDEKNKAK